jgi:methanesulfonate monooxygenase small subunit
MSVTGDALVTVNREAIRELIYRICLLLDGNKFVEWLDLCTPDFRYTISAWSPEIRRDMVWLDHDLDGITNLMKMLPKHNSDQTPLTRHASVYTIDHDPARAEADVVTSVAIFATALDGGATELWALGRYHDTVSVADGTPRLRRRNVRLETRSLGIGKHWPL